MIGEWPPLLSLPVLLDLDGVVEDLRRVGGPLPPQHIAPGLLGQGEVGGRRRALPNGTIWEIVRGELIFYLKNSVRNQYCWQ